MEKIYERFEIIPDVIRLKAFREEYINTVSKPVFHKIITNRPMIYYSNVYESKKGIFELGIVPLKKDDKKVIRNFTEYGAVNKQVKAISYMNKVIFVTMLGPLEKTGITYKISPVIILNEDIYNLIRIQNRDFNNITVDDLSKYSDFFRVSDKPYSIISESRLEDMYRTGELSLKKYKEKQESLEREAILVKTLRK